MKINNKKDLQAAIIELEKRKINQEEDLSEQFHIVKESLKPGNLIKSAFRSFKHSPEAQKGVASTIGGLGLGILTKKLFLGTSPSFIKKILSHFVQATVTKTAISNTDKLKAYGTAVYHNIFKNKGNNNNHKPADRFPI